MIARGLVSLAVVLAAAPVQCPHEADAAHCWDDAPGDGNGAPDDQDAPVTNGQS